MGSSESDRCIKGFQLSFLSAFVATPLGPVARYLFFLMALAFMIKGRLWGGIGSGIPRYVGWSVRGLLVMGVLSEMANFIGFDEAVKGYSLILEAVLGAFMGLVYMSRPGVGALRRFRFACLLALLIVSVGAVAYVAGVGPWIGLFDDKGMVYYGTLGQMLMPMFLAEAVMARNMMDGALDLVLVVVCGLCAVLSRSSVAMLGALFGCGMVVLSVLFMGRGRIRARLLLLLGGISFVLISGVVLFPSARSAVFREFTQLSALKRWDMKAFTTHRSTIWAISWDLLKQRPLWGWGLGRFDRVYVMCRDVESLGAWRSANPTGGPSHAHSDPLDLAVSVGFSGFLFYGGIVLGILRMCFGAVRRYGLRHPLALGVLGAMGGLVLSGWASGLIVSGRSTSGMFAWALAGIAAGLHCRVGRRALG